MEWLVYLFRAFLMLMVTWLSLRLIGKKSIAQMTSYEFAGVMLLTTVAAEPLVYKVVSKASIGALFIALIVILIGILSLHKSFYNVDMKPDIVIQNGKVNLNILRRNQMNIPLLLSMLRVKGYAKVSDIEFAIIEPDGQVSVLPKSGCRPVQPQDMQISPPFEGLPLPVILDGEIQYGNLRYAGLTTQWLKAELEKANIKDPDSIILAQVDAQNKLYISEIGEPRSSRPQIF